MPGSASPAALSVAPEVRTALDAGRPVVALESTIFTHGLPRPRNLEVACAAERQLCEAGVVPATIGVVGGVPTVGLADAEIERLSGDGAVVKASIRDLPVVAAKGLSAGTTVAATAFLAYQAGITVFSTGGLGGVHRGAGETFDESADLVALASTPVVVVSAGVKSILDIRATLERLETLSIPVVGWRTNRYPGFYVADSGHRIEHSAEGPEEVAAVVAARDRLGVRSGLLVANPVPEAEQLDPPWHDALIAEALEQAQREDIVGNEMTPFLLDYIQRATGGRSLDVNVAVYRNNVAVGAAIARAVAA